MATETTGLETALGFAKKVIPLGEEMAAAWGAAKDGISGAFSALEKSGETIEAYRIKLTQASGATAKFAEQLKTDVKTLNEYGVTYNKLVEANVAIAESYSRATFSAAQTREDFKKERQEIQELITVNERFGVTQKETIDLANKLGNSVFKNVDEIGKFSDTLLKFSRETGQPFSNTLREFGSYSDRFVMTLNSDKAMQAFTTLELLARRAGSSVDKLVGSISKFDDIDEAFSSGGQINRVLSYFGGSLDTLAMASASEEEKAKMLLESISGISDQFNTQMTDPNARRSVLKELSKQTGLDVNTITGLLNKNNDLSKDLQSIIKTPVVTGMATIPAEEKKKMAMDVTTRKEVTEIAQENVFIGPMSFALERMMTNQKGALLSIGSDVAARVDSAVSKFLDTGDTKSLIRDFGGAIGPVIDKIGNSAQPGTLIGEFGAVIEGTKSLGAAFKGLTETTPGSKVSEAWGVTMTNLHLQDEERKRKEHENLRDHITQGLEKANFSGRVEVSVKVDQQGKVTPPAQGAAATITTGASLNPTAKTH